MRMKQLFYLVQHQLTVQKMWKSAPFDKTIFIAHTNNDKHGNFHGHITRFLEDNDDLGSLTFDFEIFACWR